MTQPFGKSRTTRVSQIIRAPRQVIYRVFLDPDALASWLPPNGMRGHIYTFKPHEGGKFRMSLTYLDRLDWRDSPRGKTSEDTDTFAGRFVELLPYEKIVWVVQFETDQPDFSGEMRITWSLEDAEGGTEVTALCEDIPEGISLEDNETGSRSSLRKLAAFIECCTNDRMLP